MDPLYAPETKKPKGTYSEDCPIDRKSDFNRFFLGYISTSITYRRAKMVPCCEEKLFFHDDPYTKLIEIGSELLPHPFYSTDLMPCGLLLVLCSTAGSSVLS